MNLDIGCGNKKRDGFTGMDNRACEGVDIQHDIHNLPWPIADGSVYAVNASHVLEHIQPWKFFEIMDEMWRVTKKGGGVDIKVPIGISYKTDPSHTIEFNHTSFWHLDPSKEFYKTYKSKPWKILSSDKIDSNQQLRVILQKE